MKLVVRGDERVEYPLDAETVRLGRERARTVPLNDPLVSREHAELCCVVGDARRQVWEIHDLGSTNGTYVNDVLLAGPRRLAVGDRIRVGNTVLVYEEIESGRGFRNLVAVLIALATLMGAIVAWRANVAIDEAAGARARGTTVLINLTQHETEVTSSLYQNLSAFTAYAWHLAMTQLLAADAQQTRDADWSSELEEDRLRQANLALAALDLVNVDYVRRADDPTAAQTFDRERFFATNMAEVATQTDLDYQAHYATSDREATVAERLTAVAVLLSVAIFFYTGATLATSWLKYVWAGIGVVAFGVGSLAAVLIEVGTRAG